jgi:phage terminase small subunit
MSNEAPSQPQGNAPEAQPVPVGTSDAPQDSALTNLLTDQQEAFARAFVETNNRSLAYRRAYKVGVNTKPGTIWSEASRVAALPHVQARIRVLLEAAAAETVANKAALIKLLWDRIMADRRDVINHVRRCCRHCYGGERHQYQWKDEMEYALALAKTCDENATLPPDKQKPLPTDEGGYGFDPHREPNVTCDAEGCMGNGHGETVIADTTKLTGAAALIYEGVKETKDGFELKLADRNADIQQLSKLLGWSVDKVEGAIGAAGAGKLPDSAYEIPATATPEEASRRYLALVS